MNVDTAFHHDLVKINVNINACLEWAKQYSRDKS